MTEEIKIPPKVQQIIRDIESIKIQGATNVAESCFEGIKIYIEEYDEQDGGDTSIDVFMADVEKMGVLLANARPNEPLARNGIKYLLNMFKIKHPNVEDREEARRFLIEIMNEFLALLEDAKRKIIEKGVEKFGGYKGILTHCHSSTVENLCKGIDDANGPAGFSAVATETRPRFQGRITAKNLLKANVDVKMIVDSAITSFLVGEWEVPIDAVWIGCDEIMVTGETVNKVGSYAVALAAYHASKPIYVVGSILKLNPATVYDRPEIELRDSKEVWAEAPEGLKIINPAFEIVPAELITGFVTEAGILKPDEVERKAGELYEWIW